jgi:hypothetical protein
MIEGERVPFPLTVFASKTTLNPWMAIFINQIDTERTLASEQLFVNAHRVSMDVIPFLKEFRGYLGE